MSSSITLAGIYKWVDAEGNVHYGQQRPANTPSERMNVPRHAPKDTSSYKRPGQKSANAEAEKKADEPEKVKETPAEKKQRLADCKKIRNNLATMESRGRVRSKDKDGNLRYLSDQEKEERMSKSRQTLSRHCK